MKNFFQTLFINFYFFFSDQSRDNPARLTLNGRGDGFTYEVDLRGFRQTEISVDIDGNQVVVQGEHSVSNGGVICDLCPNLNFLITLRAKYLLTLYFYLFCYR